MNQRNNIYDAVYKIDTKKIGRANEGLYEYKTAIGLHKN